MRKLIGITLGCAFFAVSTTASADILFLFEEVGSDVTMTSSGTYDTTGLSIVGPYAWGSAGFEENGQHDIMGGTTVGAVDINFAFNKGTDFSQWASANGPWTASDFSPVVNSGEKGFATYGRDDAGGIIPGLGIERDDMDGAFWSPDQNWTWSNRTFASLNMIEGSYSVSDSVTGETITISIGVIPAPSVLGLLGIGLVLAPRLRRRKK